MSNIVAIDNFTVTSQEFIIPGGALISTVAPSAELTISPNQGYQIDASNFTVVSSNPEVDVPSCYFTQDGNNVILTVVFTVGATMPNNNLDIKICMRGASEELGVTIAGTVYYDTNNATPLGQNLPYSNSGPAESAETILSQLIQANTGYYFQSTPTISLRTGDPTDYNLYTNGSVFDANNRLTALRVNADYTYPFVNHAGDIIDVYAHAIAIPVIPIYVIGYSINTTVPFELTNRDLAIFGGEGANYELTIDNGATFSNGTNTISGVVPATTAFETITFPATAPGGVSQHTLEFVAAGSDLDPNFTGSWTILFTRTLSSSINITGTVTSGDSEIIVDNTGTLTLDSNTQDPQLGNITHLITPNPAITGLTLAWTNSDQILDSEFTKTEDLPDGEFDIAQTLKQISLSPAGLGLRVGVSAPSTGYNDMSYVLNNNIETYITKSYACKEFELDASSATVDTQYQYTDCDGVVQTPTITIGNIQMVCARQYPAPVVLSGDGIINTTENLCI